MVVKYSPMIASIATVTWRSATFSSSADCKGKNLEKEVNTKLAAGYMYASWQTSLQIIWESECSDWKIRLKLEQLERLRSEDTPRRLMITHTIESCWIPSQN